VPQVRKRFGQHFLEPAWVEKVVSAIRPRRDQFFVEIGPGAGALTLKLAPAVAGVVAVEIDRDLVERLRPRLPDNVTLIQGDFLEISIAAPASLFPSGDHPVRFVGNLPYNISSPILFRLIALQASHAIQDATLMLQAEVAERILARPGSAEYGALSILIQFRADVKSQLILPPGAFRPAPKVRSALVHLHFHPPPVSIAGDQMLERLVRTIFTQRRKTLANALTPFAVTTGLTSAEALRRAHIDPLRRPQTLQLVEIARLVEVFHSGEK